MKVPEDTIVEIVEVDQPYARPARSLGLPDCRKRKHFLAPLPGFGGCPIFCVVQFSELKTLRRNAFGSESRATITKVELIGSGWKRIVNQQFVKNQTSPGVRALKVRTYRKTEAKSGLKSNRTRSQTKSLLLPGRHEAELRRIQSAL